MSFEPYRVTRTADPARAATGEGESAMRCTFKSSTRTRAFALAAVLALAASAGTARAQNTYLDVPFNQGSLFYRPSGARPPRTTYRYYAPPPRVYQPTVRYYHYPAAPYRGGYGYRYDYSRGYWAR